VKPQISPGPDTTVRHRFSEWLSSLDILKDENLALQHCLAEEVKRAGGRRELLEALEKFLDSLLNKDVHISLLRRDIRAHEALMLTSTTGVELSSQHQKLQDDVTRMCVEFARLKADFEQRFCVHA
jgi:hypothetical protein